MPSEPAHNMTSILANSGLQREELTSEVHNAVAPSKKGGPLKGMIKSHQDSLYEYISWKDPASTLRSYFIAMGILFGVHYLPLTQWTLKAGATTFGGIFITEFISQSFGSTTFLTQMRPKQYMMIPEEDLNAALKDIYDLVQYSVIQTQRIMFAQDLDKVFFAFIGFTSIFWLTKAIPPFWLTVLGLTALYAAPLISPWGSEVVREAKKRMEELRIAAMKNGRKLAEDGQTKMAELASQAREATAGIGQRAEDLVQNGKQMAADLPTQVQGATDTAKSLLGEAEEYISDICGTETDDKNNTKSAQTDSPTETKNTGAPGYVLGSASSADDMAETPREDIGSTLSSTPRQVSSEETDSVVDSVSKYSEETNTASEIMN